MHAFIGMKPRTHHRQALAGFVRCVHAEKEELLRQQRMQNSERETKRREEDFMTISSGTTFAGNDSRQFLLQTLKT